MGSFDLRAREKKWSVHMYSQFWKDRKTCWALLSVRMSVRQFETQLQSRKDRRFPKAEVQHMPETTKPDNWGNNFVVKSFDFNHHLIEVLFVCKRLQLFSQFSTFSPFILLDTMKQRAVLNVTRQQQAYWLARLYSSDIKTQISLSLKNNSCSFAGAAMWRNLALTA